MGWFGKPRDRETGEVIKRDRGQAPRGSYTRRSDGKVRCGHGYAVCGACNTSYSR